MNRVFFIYLTSITLLVLAKKVEQKFSKPWPNMEASKLEKTLTSNSKPIRESFKKKVNFDLLAAYVTGNKKSLPIKLKKYHKTLNLMHLFTPSGLHFSSIYVFFIPLFNFLKKKNTPVYFLTHTMLCAMPFLLSGFNSIKRICIFYILKVIRGFLRQDQIKQIENFYLILLTFLIDGIRGSFNESPLSFCYSFTFLSLIFCHKDFKTQRIFFYFLGAQIILTFFSTEQFSLLGLFFGFLLTYIFSFFFPFWLSIFLIPIKIQSFFYINFIYQKSIDVFVRSILFFSKLTLEFDFYFSSFVLVLAVLIGSYKMKREIKFFLLSTLLLIHSNPLLNFPISSFKKPIYPVNFERIKKNKIDSTYISRGKVIIIFKNGKKCVHDLRPEGISEKCKYL